MATITPVRISGVVLGTETRTVPNKNGGDPYVFRTANVLVGNKGCTEVSYRNDQAGAFPSEGEVIDVLANSRVYNGQPQHEFYGPFEDPFAASKS